MTLVDFSELFEFLKKENKQGLLQATKAWIILCKQQTNTKNDLNNENRTFFFVFYKIFFDFFGFYFNNQQQWKQELM